MAKKEERFEVTFRDGSQLKDEGVRQILVDKETGVNYLCWKSGYGAAITPLLDSEGKVSYKVKSGFVEDNMKVDVIKKYFQSWLDNDVEIVKQTFSENALYSECYGPEYHGLSQIVTWFENWNNKGQVLEWTIKRIFEQNQTLIVEWYFRCNYDGKIDGFDGVTIADFDKDMKILKLCEFQSKAEHYYPYES